MYIKRIRVQNFKSFEHLNIKLEKFQVIIGPNESGKSNFLNILSFFKDLFLSNMDNAISMHGGITYLRNVNIKNRLLTEFEISLGFKDSMPGFTRLSGPEAIKYHLISKEINYKVGLKTYKTVEKYKIANEELMVRYDVLPIEIYDERKLDEELKYSSKDTIDKIQIIIIRKGNNIYPELRKEKGVFDLEFDQLYYPFTIQSLKEKISGTETFLEKFFLPNVSMLLYSFFRNMSLYEINTKLPKQAVLLSGQNILEEDGSNFAVVLKNILKSDELKEKYIKTLQDILPFIDDIRTEKFTERYLIPSIKQEYFDTEYLPASLISDGTIYISSILIPLLFEDKSVIIIEEPFTKVHPKLISRLIQLMLVVSNEKQIIMTTHNPEIIKQIDVNNLFFIKRNEYGYSIIEKLSNNERVKKYLDNNVGIDFIFAKDLIK